MAMGAAAVRVMLFGVRSASPLFSFEQLTARRRIASADRMIVIFFFMSLYFKVSD
jgi:hypothetical protein